MKAPGRALAVDLSLTVIGVVPTGVAVFGERDRHAIRGARLAQGGLAVGAVWRVAVPAGDEPENVGLA